MGHNSSPWEHRGTALRLDGWIDVHAYVHPPESEAKREARRQAMPPVPTGLLVFPRYDATATPAATRITPMDALVRLPEDRLFLGHPVTAAAVGRFLAWLVRGPACGIAYPDTDAAERILRDLLAGLDPSRT